jgi:hypothetical protein
VRAVGVTQLLRDTLIGTPGLAARPNGRVEPGRPADILGMRNFPIFSLSQIDESS